MIIIEGDFYNLLSKNIKIFTVVTVLFSLARSFFVPFTAALTSFIVE